MATPVGHSLAAYAVYKLFSGRETPKGGRWLLVSVSMANAPDLDFLPGLFLGQPALYHQGMTHSLSWATGVSLIVAGLVSLRGESFGPFFGLCFLAYLSHLFMDILGPDNRSPHGLPLFWPISEVYLLSPVSLFLGMHHGASDQISTWEWFERLFDLYNLGAIAVEVAWLAPIIGLLRKER